jgi:hypothetical protein
VVGHSPQKLVGRERDIETLLAFLDRAARAGGAMLASGEAGVGKTALLDVAALHAAQRGRRLLRATQRLATRRSARRWVFCRAIGEPAGPGRRNPSSNPSPRASSITATSRVSDTITAMVERATTL